MSFLDYQFHRAQSRIKSKPLQSGDVKGGSAVRPLFKPELADIEPKNKTQRLVDYIQKRAALEAA